MSVLLIQAAHAAEAPRPANTTDIAAIVISVGALDIPQAEMTSPWRAAERDFHPVCPTPVPREHGVMGSITTARPSNEKWSMRLELQMLEYQERLRRMALSDDRFVTSVLGMGRDPIEASGLDPKTHAMVTLAALLSVNAAESSYNASAEVALASGASLDEIVGILVAIAPAIGLGRVVSAAPALGLALGYDVEAALEAPPEADGRLHGRRTRDVDGRTR